MTEGSVSRPKRMGTRFFKNPPQPHMCIQDFLRGSVHPCYINVLSWDKIGMASCPFERLPLYGGMKINPPRTESPEVTVFFVMANPEILRQNGKNATDPKEQSILIELLLDFIEAMNKGIVFMRHYKILNDRDITGELKEIWMAVQSDRAKLQNGTSAEEVKRPVPQYPQYQDQSQDHQKQQQKKQQQQQHQHQQQQYRSLQNQSHQHLIQQMQHPSDDKQLSQPPQYQSNYMMPSRGSAMESSESYDLAYIRPPQNTLIPQSDHMYESRSVANHYNVNVNKVRDRIVPNVIANPPTPPQPSVPYPAPQYQYPQLPRQIGAYNNPNIHPNPGLPFEIFTPPGAPLVINPALAPNLQIHYDPYFYPIGLHDKRVHQKVHRMPQPQQPQIQLVHASPVSPYEEMKKRIFRPQANTPPKNTSHKRQAASPTHPAPHNKESVGKSKSPVKVLQRDNSVSEHENAAGTMTDKISDETFNDTVNENSNVQVTDLDEDEPHAASGDIKITKTSDDNLTASFMDNQVNSKQCKTKIMVLKKNKPFDDINLIKHNGRKKNGVKSETEQQDNDADNRTNEGKVEDEKLNQSPESEQNGYIDELTDKQVESDDKISNGMNTIMDNNIKLNASTSEDILVKQSNKINGQPNNFGKDKEIFEMYAIQRKSEVKSTPDELTNDMAQISINDCTETNEIGAVPS
ncbi:putative uncharacterized protein DDB_G0291608 [Chelonus insularis]|uniref:putative uncharacterized protein DDB_G0291608 n=1 Tax=Chelonus insularis TaxID=460826 RepID=UPI001589BF06|nr:putative uncharacterized protein DDB_G0291608 [Chelonus insularis]XP_034938648.1 putative uncharacterized protein DDB_G0291608 [Chelonus insularis]